MALHILIGTATEDIEMAKSVALTGRNMDWIVPKNAMPGDNGLLFVKGRGIIASAVLRSMPRKIEEGRWSGRYGGEVGDVRFLKKTVSEEELGREFPTWAWLRYPRKYTTPPRAVSERLLELVDESAMSELALTDIDLIEVEASEGAARLREHLVLERKRSIIEQKKKMAYRTMKALKCEACGFDFKSVYGQLGDRFCEVHHLKPLSINTGLVKTTLDDLAILCSNCHRMIHRGNTITLDELRAIIQAHAQS